MRANSKLYALAGLSRLRCKTAKMALAVVGNKLILVAAYLSKRMVGGEL
jgi:hypothetical protein